MQQVYCAASIHSTNAFLTAVHKFDGKVQKGSSIEIGGRKFKVVRVDSTAAKLHVPELEGKGMATSGVGSQLISDAPKVFRAFQQLEAEGWTVKYDSFIARHKQELLKAGLINEKDEPVNTLALAKPADNTNSEVATTEAANTNAETTTAEAAQSANNNSEDKSEDGAEQIKGMLPENTDAAATNDTAATDVAETQSDKPVVDEDDEPPIKESAGTDVTQSDADKSGSVSMERKTKALRLGVIQLALIDYLTTQTLPKPIAEIDFPWHNRKITQREVKTALNSLESLHGIVELSPARISVVKFNPPKYLLSDSSK